MFLLIFLMPKRLSDSVSYVLTNQDASGLSLLTGGLGPVMRNNSSFFSLRSRSLQRQFLLLLIGSHHRKSDSSLSI